jgi:hypothetical protein
MVDQRLSLSADCSRCAALCCVALAVDRGAEFAVDKPAGLPCPNLSACHRCAVHGRRVHLGLAGCVKYDCLGAGQRVTALFGQHSWRHDAETKRRMLDAFRALRRVHELVELLRAAERLPLPPDRSAELQRVMASLDRAWTEEQLAAFERGDEAARVLAFLRSLAPYVKSRACPPSITSDQQQSE